MPKREISIKGDVARIPLTKGKVALIDAADVEHVENYSWSTDGTGYARAWINGKLVKLHRFILGCTDRGQTVDHINGDRLDCRRSNLRVVSQAANCRNTDTGKQSKSGYRGVVYFDSQNKPWRLYPSIGNQQISFGYYSDPELPAMLFDCIQIKIANALDIEVSPRSLNFPDSDYSDHELILSQHLTERQLERLGKAIDKLVSRSISDLTYVYLAQRKDGAVKIGVSRNPVERVKKIRYGKHCIGWCPETRLIHSRRYESADTAYTRERELHGLFADYRIEGEWFQPDVLNHALSLL